MMGRKSSVTPEMGEIILRMREEGRPTSAIAAAVGRSCKVVRGWLAFDYNRKHGTVSPEPEKTLDGYEDGRHLRGLTPDALRRLKLIDEENMRAEDEGRKPDYSGIK